jgi:hypothetical protein
MRILAGRTDHLRGVQEVRPGPFGLFEGRLRRRKLASGSIGRGAIDTRSCTGTAEEGGSEMDGATSDRGLRHRRSQPVRGPRQRDRRRLWCTDHRRAEQRRKPVGHQRVLPANRDRRAHSSSRRIRPVEHAQRCTRLTSRSVLRQDPAMFDPGKQLRQRHSRPCRSCYRPNPTGHSRGARHPLRGPVSGRSGAAALNS